MRAMLDMPALWLDAMRDVASGDNGLFLPVDDSMGGTMDRLSVLLHEIGHRRARTIKPKAWWPTG